MKLEAGTRLGHYEILGPIGAGGMGVVYQAEDTRLGRHIALKFLPEGRFDNSEALERFRREARAASALNHPHICTVYDIGEHEGKPFLSMELLEGQTLSDRIREGPLELEELLELSIQIADALDATHEKGIVHRDIKPANVFITKRGDAKVLDFGLAKQLYKAAPAGSDAETASVHRSTDPGIIVGTVGYMSPEQVAAKEVDHRTDLFSLGAVIYEMATGRRAFSGNSAGVVFEAILNRTPEPPLRLNPSLPPKLEDVLGKTLEKDPSLRTQSAAELKADLKRLARDSGSRPASVQAATARPARRLGLAALVIGGLALASGLVFVLRPVGSQPRITGSVQLTDDGRPKGQRLLTDGTRVYFTQERDGRDTLMQVSAAGGEALPVPVALAGDIDLLDIRNDGSAVLMRSSETPGLWSVPLPSGPMQRLGSLEADWAAWSPDDAYLACVRDKRVFLAKADGTGDRVLADLPHTPSYPRWSPDGRRIRFTVLSWDDPFFSIWEVRRDGSDLHRVLFSESLETDAEGDWTPDGRYYLFHSWRSKPDHGYPEIWVSRERTGLLSFEDSEPVQLTFGPMVLTQPVISSDGKRVFVVGEQTRGELVRLDARSGRFVRDPLGVAATAVSFAPDGQWAAYILDNALWISRADGTDRRKLTRNVEFLNPSLPRWSPDGQSIAFADMTPPDTNRIYKLSRDGGTAHRLVPDETTQSDPCWSPDGKLILYGGSSEGVEGIRLLDLETGNVTVLPSSEGLSSPRWSPNGRFVAALRDGQSLDLFDWEKQSWVPQVAGLIDFPSWSHDGRHVYFNQSGDDGDRIMRVSISDAQIEEVADVRDMPRLGSYGGTWFSLAPDDSPIVLRDTSIYEVFSLALEVK